MRSRGIEEEQKDNTKYKRFSIQGKTHKEVDREMYRAL